jgi:replication factor C large subunit
MDKSYLPLFRKYAPKKPSEIIGQDKAVAEIRHFIHDYQKQKKRALLAYGPTGTGKTASIYAIANELGIEVVEINASDFRNEQGINSLVGAAIGQHSLFAKSKIILVDEIDGIAGKEDRGGLAALTTLIDRTRFPIIMTANNPWDYKFNKVRTRSLMAEFHALQAASIHTIIKHIASHEKIRIADEVLKAMARMAGGDARAAINDLQTLAGFAEEEKDLGLLGERNRQETIINALLKILKSTDISVAKGAFDNVDEDLDQCLLWLDENMPKEYTKPEDLANAYEMISRADVFKGRIRRWQHWRFLVYINDLLTAGVALAKKEKYPGYVQYRPTMKLLKIWQANQRYAQRKSIAAKIAAKTHTSTRVAIQNTLPYLKPVFEKRKKDAEMLADYLGLEKEELDWLRNK